MAFNYKQYKESDSVNAYKNALDELNNNKPSDYQSKYASLSEQAMNNILNREKFNYDVNGDALYQQYKDKYIQQGKQAMADTIGKASAMTGGFGNSYAATAGQQAYNSSLEKLNDVVPELYQMAYDRYSQEGNDMLNRYNLLNSADEKDYSRWSDSMNRWLNERDYATGRYDNERSIDRQDYQMGYNAAMDKYNADVADEESAYNRAWQEDERNYQRQQDAIQLAMKSAGSGSGSGGSGSGGDIEEETIDANKLLKNLPDDVKNTVRKYADAATDAESYDKLYGYLTSSGYTDKQAMAIMGAYTNVDEDTYVKNLAGNWDGTFTKLAKNGDEKALRSKIEEYAAKVNEKNKNTNVDDRITNKDISRMVKSYITKYAS